MNLSLSSPTSPGAPVMVHKAQQTPSIICPPEYRAARWQPFGCALALYQMANGKRRDGGGVWGFGGWSAWAEDSADCGRCHSTDERRQHLSAWRINPHAHTHTHPVLSAVADTLSDMPIQNMRHCGGVFHVRAEKNNCQSGSLLHYEDCYL